MKQYQQANTRNAVSEMTRNGIPVREIADTLELSTQRVYQHLKALGMSPASSASSPMPRRVR